MCACLHKVSECASAETHKTASKYSSQQPVCWATQSEMNGSLSLRSVTLIDSFRASVIHRRSVVSYYAA